MKQTIVLYPAPSVGHLVPMVELANLLLGYGFQVTVITVEGTVAGGGTIATATSRLTPPHPSISFHHLPPISLTSEPNSSPMFDLLRLSNPHLLAFIRTLTGVRALILDLFCTDAIDVAAELSLPAYFFFPTAASNLVAFLHLPALQSQVASAGGFKALTETTLNFPGIQPIPASHLPEALLGDDGESCKKLLSHFQRLPLAEGIIVNTFCLLEERALAAISDGLCLAGRSVPQIYCVVPLVAEASRGGEKNECLQWLDAEPSRSVVFLSCGSMGFFSAEQLKEIAVGLERSRQRFLWVVRTPRNNDPASRFLPQPEPNLEALLPANFLERTRETGMVVRSWAPQAAVLRHEAVGGFVTHCGWNSVLEAIVGGVPMIAWPLYSEQKMNKVYLVKEMGLAVEMIRHDEGMVGADEVEQRIRWLMETDAGRELRKRADEVKGIAAAALREGGSSHAALLELVTKLNA